jgi:fumarylpyruvate hydrolase
VGQITPASEIGHPSRGRIRLAVNGEIRQDADIAEMIWSVPEQIAFLSRYYALEAGDIIMTGTPAGVGKAKVGDELAASVAGLAELRVKIIAPR